MFRIDYADLSNEDVGGDAHVQHSVYEPVAIAIKNFQIKGLFLYMDEFPRHKRTKLREASTIDDDMFLSAPCELESPGIFDPDASSRLSDVPGRVAFADLLPSVKILGLSSGKQNIKVKLKQNDALPGPKVSGCVSLLMLSFVSFLSTGHTPSEGISLSENLDHV